MINAVQVHTSNVSVNTPNAWIRPCLTGWLTVATAAALGAEPSPASLLNKPRLKPIIMAVPTPPPMAWPMPKALSIISIITSGIRSKRITITATVTTRYTIAMSGTTTVLTRAMRCMPPNITRRVREVRTIDIHMLLTPNAWVNARLMVLLCTMLLVSPKSIMIATAKITANQRFFIPLLI